VKIDHSDFSIVIPHAVAVATLASIACLPWFRWRFSLRALLIATTLARISHNFERLASVGWFGAVGSWQSLSLLGG
jgi:hypothetical protein